MRSARLVHTAILHELLAIAEEAPPRPAAAPAAGADGPAPQTPPGSPVAGPALSPAQVGIRAAR